MDGCRLVTLIEVVEHIVDYLNELRGSTLFTLKRWLDNIFGWCDFKSSKKKSFICVKRRQPI